MVSTLPKLSIFILMIVIKRIHSQPEFTDTIELPCTDPTDPINGRVAAYGGNLLVEYFCDDGFYMLGESFGACILTEGRWTIEKPWCLAYDCPVPEAPARGFVEMERNNSIAKFYCMRGHYLMSTTDTLYCLGNRWSGYIPLCVAASVGRSSRGQIDMRNDTEPLLNFDDALRSSDDTCSRYRVISPPEIDNGYARNNYLFNEARRLWSLIANYTCDVGFELVNDDNRYMFCRSYRWWAPVQPKCKKAVKVFYPCEKSRCAQVCIPGYGRHYACGCNRGYRLASDGWACNDINECKKNNGGCDHICYNRLGTRMCACKEGYLKVGDHCVERRQKVSRPTMLNNERDLITRLLKQNIVTLCKETISYDTQLEIDGIICISTGIESQQIVVKVHNFFQKLGSKSPTPRVGPDTEPPQKRKFEDNEWQERKQEKRYLLSPNQLPFPKEQLPFFQQLQDDVKPKTEGEIETRLRTPTIDLVELNRLNGFQGENDRKSYTPPIPHTIKSLEQSEHNFQPVDNNNDLSSCSDMADDDDTGIMDDDVDGENHVTSNSPITYPQADNGDSVGFHTVRNNSKLSPELPSPRKHAPADENSMIECKLGKNCTTDEDMSKVPIRQVKDIPCKRCSIVLSDGEAFEQHNTEIHSVYTCRVCFNTFTCRNNMKRHMRLHTGFRPYSCKLCNESFTRKDDIKRHLIRHSFDKPFRCNVCRKGYMDRKTVKNHIRKEHNSKIIHICQTCGEAFDNTSKFQEHKKNHPELKMFQCALCKFTGSNLLAFNKHQLVHEVKRDYRCDPCGIVFGDPLRYTTHLRKHRSDPNFAHYRCCFCNLNSTTYDEFVRHEHSHDHSHQVTCYVCMKQFQSEGALAEHKKTHTTLNLNNVKTEAPALFPSFITSQLPQQQPIFPSFTNSLTANIVTESNEHVQPKNIANTPSPVFKNGTPRYDDIELLVKNGNENKDIKFENSKYETPSSSSVQNDYWCAECQHGFATEHHLTEHIALAHENNSVDGSGDRTWIPDDACAEEDKTTKPASEVFNFTKAEPRDFSDNPDSGSEMEDYPGSLNSSSSSIRISSVPIFNNSPKTNKRKSRPESKVINEDIDKGQAADDIQGDIGENSNSNASISSPEMSESKPDDSLEHIKGNKNFYKQEKFTCDVCFLNFSEFEPFDAHNSLVHRKYICHFCGKSFTSRPNRDRHIRYHTGEKPFKCDVCQQCFVRGDDLRYHRTSKHPDVKPYICSICEMSFPWAKDLEKHVKTHGIS